jgi:hypothetical protein
MTSKENSLGSGVSKFSLSLVEVRGIFFATDLALIIQEMLSGTCHTISAALSAAQLRWFATDLHSINSATQYRPHAPDQIRKK